MGCGHFRADRHRGHDRRAACALPREPRTGSDRCSKPHHGDPTDDCLRNCGQPDAVGESVRYPFNQPLAEPVSDPFADSVPMSFPKSVTEPDRGCLPNSK